MSLISTIQVWFCFVFFLTKSVNLCLLIGGGRPFYFNIIINKFGINLSSYNYFFLLLPFAIGFLLS